ncbi:hypothetical protein SAMN04490357_0068 [Streptomyces misionensis]|uniref:Uncharacterized protein n=1 Tax=Streptomyces misionensis TaxID=67331 RepID=A0A1H4I9H4_9ACTN|nr:hypothetical protein SAMN04490357_0068 [Streptomyces misionensis]
MVTRDIYVDSGQYYIHGDNYDTSNWRFDNLNGLVGVLDSAGYPSGPGEFAIVATGLNSGEVRVTIEICSERPSEVDCNNWDEIAEVSLALASDWPRISTMIPTDALKELPDFSSVGPGPYRVRVHARGRDAANELMDLPDGQEPVEEHLVQVWAAPSTASRVHKQTDNVGKRLMPER